ncbi:S8 family serine peptidase [Pseudobacteroides cellulosolvens]|uniref:Thermitase n=1 Tax=Pseudobacteroides cellulosolvens ATCC 35603 = DSM 2933 TaxID=398512 RepID=A0A0L6JJE0_9FIRM|nr:S8 family serine peptidase [Pseudobacteroides cellulosolvens]KNY25996.1 Thermitase [Pseudobacteroides cellulosolvens ATCC 35603 = DSM 2933]
MSFKKNMAKVLAVTTLVTGVLYGSQLVFANGKCTEAESNIKSKSSVKFAEGRVVVVFKEGYDVAADSKELKNIGVKSFQNLRKAKETGKTDRNSSKEKKSKKTLLLSLEDKSREGVLKAVKELNKQPNVVYAVPDFLIEFSSTTPNDVNYDALYGMNKIGAPQAWDKCTGSNEVVVGVIDTGIDYNHPDLIDNIWTNPGESGFTSDGKRKETDGVDNDGNGYIDDVHGFDFGETTEFINDPDPMDESIDGHGTHCAGIIAAKGNNGIGVTGVTWNTKVAALKIAKKNNSNYIAYYSSAVKAIDYATAMGFDITSNSWGVEKVRVDMLNLNSEWNELSPLLEAAVADGGLFVTSAGNRCANLDTSPNYPACYDLDNIIVVANSDVNDKLDSSSNWGNNSVDLAAPGSSIYSTIPGGKYGYLSGTSMAAPHVAGAAALLLSANRSLTTSQLKQIILSTVDNVDNLQVLTHGRLNVSKAINKVMGAVKIGDLNKDGYINNTDHNMLSKHLLGSTPLTYAQQKVAADVNGDGFINALDNGLFQKYLAGTITVFPAGSNFTYTYGDVDNDGAVTTDDSTIVFNYLSGKILLSNKQLLKADANGDNVVALEDTGLMQQYVNGSIANLPVGDL